MNTNTEKVIEFLESYGGPVCDDCISSKCQVEPRQQVNQICRRLEKIGKLVRSELTCKVCQRNKKGNSIHPSGNKKGGSEFPGKHPNELPPPRDKQAAILDSIRRSMINTLNELNERQRGHEGFSSIVRRLRDEGRLDPVPACMMLTLGALRNIVVYEGSELRSNEWQVVIHLWAALSNALSLKSH